MRMKRTNGSVLKMHNLSLFHFMRGDFKTQWLYMAYGCCHISVGGNLAFMKQFWMSMNL